jgi:putative peptide zinc metalloprotease protein
MLGSALAARAMAAAPDTTAPGRRRFNPLAWRVPLGNPGAVLNRLGAVQRLCFTRTAAAVWGLMLALLLGLAWWHGPALWAHGATWLGTPRFAWLALLLYPPVKLVHELAHALAVRRWGGTVREAGVTLMLGVPVPYVDASAASAFARARERMVVSAAGILAELAMASVSLMVWLTASEGWVRDAAFTVLIITTVSTLMFNANPLQRLDGYHVLCDAWGLPNLGPRSRAWWLQALQRRLLDTPSSEAMALAPGERKWLVAYAPLSWAWTLVISALSVAWLGSIAWALGAAAALLVGVMVVLRPAWALVSTLAHSARTQTRAAQRWRRWLGVAAGGLGIVLMAPLPHRLVAQGVVWPPEQAQLRAESGGVVSTVHHADGDTVTAGTLVLSLSNPDLQAQSAQADARVHALEADWMQTQGGVPAPDSERVANLGAQLEAARAEALQWQTRLHGLGVRAQTSGRLALPPTADLAGHFLKEGALVGQVLTGAPPTVRVAVPQDRAAELRGRPASGATTTATATAASSAAPPAPVSVRLADAPARVREGHVLRDSEGAVPQLPSAALAERHGGDWPTDPADADGLRPLKPVVLVDVAVQPDPGEPADAVHRLGARAWVRFDLGWSPLAWQGAQALRRAWLRQVHPQR